MRRANVNESVERTMNKFLKGLDDDMRENCGASQL